MAKPCRFCSLHAHYRSYCGYYPGGAIWHFRRGYRSHEAFRGIIYPSAYLPYFHAAIHTAAPRPLLPRSSRKSTKQYLAGPEPAHRLAASCASPLFLSRGNDFFCGRTPQAPGGSKPRLQNLPVSQSHTAKPVVIPTGFAVCRVMGQHRHQRLGERHLCRVRLRKLRRACQLQPPSAAVNMVCRKEGEQQSRDYVQTRVDDASGEGESEGGGKEGHFRFGGQQV